MSAVTTAHPTTAPGSQPAHDQPSITAKAGRYVVVTLVASPANLIAYAMLLAATAWPAVVANLVAASLIVGPTFAVTRWWVWEIRDRQGVGREVAAYWAITAVNVAASSAAAAALDLAGATDAVLVSATLMVYAVLWLIRFGVLDVLFTRRR